MKIKRKQLENSIWGFILGDCLGVPYEFKEQGTFKYKKFAEFGTFNQPAGTWSDDTSLMLALIDSYEDGKFDIEKHKQNLRDFYKQGKYTVDGLFDIGNATREAIVSDFNIDTKNQLGNGGLLRCWLIKILYEHYHKDYETIGKFIKLTHSTEMFDFYEKLYTSFINKEDVKTNFNKEKFYSIIKKDKNISKVSGTIHNTLKIIVEAIYNDHNLEDVIKKGGDTDSNAAIFGSLYYINRKVSIKDRKRIRKYDYLNEMINNFLDRYESTKTINLIETIELNIKPFLPLFFRQKHNLKKLEETPLRLKRTRIYDERPSYLEDKFADSDDASAIKRIFNKIIETGEFILEYYVILFIDVVSKNETLEEAGMRFATKIYNEVFEKKFDEIEPDEAGVYSQFIGKPNEAARFLFYKYLQTGKYDMVCKDVMEVDFENRKVKVDFTFAYNYENENPGEWMYSQNIKHLNDFRICKKYPKIKKDDLFNIGHQYDLGKFRISFEDIIRTMEKTCKEKNFRERYENGLRYKDEDTGWSCGFTKRKFGNILEFRYLYNSYIDEYVRDYSDPNGTFSEKAEMRRIQNSIIKPTIGMVAKIEKI